ncbi:DUF2007 domain-containing protein [Cellulophaga sp. E16_2]|uniref:DUF2007 domain-containing protein n=1 Tax=Cellulophaga algicola (strain DSM 14237 / IC166 / ACAM 630) TaxID=688270 RepID=E6X8R4_CELAD|nr:MULTISPECIES: DUF2007 domain-containing protein [Cellulophaga]ADV48659.1 hypothetical protein Celal_1345 [Cellulophaga algicola DSM 14237]MBO0591113.1 DUF2007 domain-containing protein [Cellulophaga sp. E16_2]
MIDSEKYTKIYSGTQVTVILLKGLLEEAYIPYIEKNEQNSGVIAGFVGGTESTIALSVLGRDLDKAKGIVAEYENGIAKN